MEISVSEAQSTTQQGLIDNSKEQNGLDLASAVPSTIVQEQVSASPVIADDKFLVSGSFTFSTL